MDQKWFRKTERWDVVPRIGRMSKNKEYWGEVSRSIWQKRKIHAGGMRNINLET